MRGFFFAFFLKIGVNVYIRLTYDCYLWVVLISNHGTEKKQFFASLAARGAAEGKVYDARRQEVNKC
jgi:hypothetical protein